MDKRLCCCIPNQTKLNNGCQELAEYQIWMGDNPTPDDYTESCAKHLEEMLDDSVKFVVLRIEQAVEQTRATDGACMCAKPKPNARVFMGEKLCLACGQPRR